MELDAARCYRALLARDRRFDGRFFVGVVTTGIYCRPICPARTPFQRNVRFFACAAAAEAAGFRPCRRCRPEAAPGTPAWAGSSATVSRALRLIAQGAFDDADTAALAARLGVGERHLRRLFLAHLGAPPGAIARAGRVHLARRLLGETAWPIARVAFAAGFASVRQFNHAMRATFRESPRALRARGRAELAPDRDALVLRLAYRPPLDWPTLRAFLALRATPGVEVVDGQTYERTIAVDGAAGTLALRPVPERCHVLLSLRLPAPDGIRGVVARARRILDLDADPLRIAAQLRRSAPLAAAVKARPGLRVPGAWDSFELAVRAILGQQVTVRGATTLAGRLVARFGTPLGAAARPGLTHLFPTPAHLRTADLAAIGMPAARAGAIRALAAAVADGRLALDDASGPDEIVAQLVALPGVGVWTAQYVAMRACGEPDAFPATDLGLRRALGNGAGPISAAALAGTAEAWRPWRAYAAMYLWTRGEPDDARDR
jgi:AraC family transcriptional regulator of adaptative response / DNA-3-methyladenine glycosylase II